VLAALAAGLLPACSVLDRSSPSTTIPSARAEAWQHVPGTCDPAVEGAVFTRSVDGCGGPGAAFDSDQIYLPAIVRDEATESAPCAGVATGGACWRMWYVGNDEDENRRIGYAVSPDGVTWTRVAGGAADGSILDVGGGEAFDSHGASSPTVIKDGDEYQLWYVGLGDGNAIQGVGHAVSSDGRTWTKVPGPAEGGAVLRESGVKGTFDQHEVITSTVLKDVATEQLPCTGVASGDPCYRMWYEGVDKVDYYRYHVGYATSPDGVTWTKVPGPNANQSVLGLGPDGGFDDRGVGVPIVIKDGPRFRMWYEAFNRQKVYSIGVATSPDGVTWTADPAPAFTGWDDPGTFDDESVWTATVVKGDADYRMWYTVSAKPSSQRIGLAAFTPGATLPTATATSDGETTTLELTTAVAIPADGSVLVTLPPGVTVDKTTFGSADGFGEVMAAVTTVTDAVAAGVARPALLLMLPAGAEPGPKRVTLHTGADGGSGPIVVQTLGDDVLEHAVIAPA
jgi:hypothetical protein